MGMLFMGVDAGTQGVRCIIANETGDLIAAKSAAFESLNIAQTPRWCEQSPIIWAQAAEEAVTGCIAQLTAKGLSARGIRAIAIDGTSGTIVPLDAAFRPLCNGIMYNDPRAKGEAAIVHAAMGAHERKLGLWFGASFSLARILWFLRNRPDIYEKTRVFAHQADYIAGLLTGEYCITDDSNALKTGFDPIAKRWPKEIANLGIDMSKLPVAVRSGEAFARVNAEAAARFGLCEGTPVVGGATDGTASALAAGAVREGSWASIIGTTLVLKGVTRELILDPTGSSYSHRLPGGEWLLGGAGNVGGRCLTLAANGRGYDEINARAEALIPTGARCYPLVGKGERFPFVDPDFEGFYRGDILGDRLYPALMEGIGFVERLAFERMQALGCAVGDTICVSGGVCRSDVWLKIRASILNRRLAVPKVAEAAMGAALLAAVGETGSIASAAESMIQFERAVEPDAELARRYGEIYSQFLRELAHLQSGGDR